MDVPAAKLLVAERIITRQKIPIFSIVPSRLRMLHAQHFRFGDLRRRLNLAKLRILVLLARRNSVGLYRNSLSLLVAVKMHI